MTAEAIFESQNGSGGMFAIPVSSGMVARGVRMAIEVVIAKNPIVIASASLSKVLNACNSPLRTPLVIGIACPAMAALLALAEWLARHRRGIDKLTPHDGLLIGTAHVGVLISGRSRSGSTLTASLALGFARAGTAECRSFSACRPPPRRGCMRSKNLRGLSFL